MAVTGQQIHDESGYDDDDIAIANVEYLIDNAINYINLVAGLSMSNLSGSSPNKTVTLTAGQETIVKALTILLVRAYVDKGPNTAVSAVSVTAVTSDPQYRVYMKIVNVGIDMLRGRSFERA